jgi:hypothetical protein
VEQDSQGSTTGDLVEEDTSITGVHEAEASSTIDDVQLHLEPEPDGELNSVQPTVRRSARAVQTPQQYEPSFKGKSYAQIPDPVFPEVEPDNLNHQKYNVSEAQVYAMVLMLLREGVMSTTTQSGVQFVTTYTLKRGIKKFGDKAVQATHKEMKQMVDRECFHPIHKSSLNETEGKRVLESLLFLTEKRDKSIKARHCANGSTQRAYMTRESVSSLTVSTESTLLTAVIEALEERDIATCDIPNAFIQTSVKAVDSEGNRIIMKVRGVLAEILCEMEPEYREYLVQEGGQSVLYLHISKAIYGLLESAMLF